MLSKGKSGRLQSGVPSSLRASTLTLDAPVPVQVTAASRHQNRCRGQCNEQFANTIFNIDEPCSCWSPSQVPKTSVNLDGDVSEKFMCHPSILTQGSWEWGVSQISTGRILHSGLNFRWTDFLYGTFTPNPPYMVNTNTNKHNGIWFLVQMFQKESNLTKVRGEIYNFE